ncbi:uncharacterized protein LOC100878836 isoform X4 [Megachile rotundata]
MMILGDKYNIPYLYLPWLVNTMKGMALYEGPILVNLVNMLLPNVTLPARTLILAAFLLYVEELFIWNFAFIKFRHCWNDYHYQKESTVEKVQEKLFIVRHKKMLHQENTNYKPNIAFEKLKIERKPIEISNKTDHSNSLDCLLTSVKSSIASNNDLLSRNQFLDTSG